MARPGLHVDDAQLTAYRCLLENARAMLQAAREERWHDLSSIDAQRQECFGKIVETDFVSTRPTDIAARMEIIQNILECDEQTRMLVRAWQSETTEVPGPMDRLRVMS